MDQAVLEQQPVGAYVALRCGRCSGTFVPGDCFREIRAKAALEVHSQKSKSIQASFQRPSRINCLNDGNPMMSLSIRHVEIDVCPKCFGLWLDRGELEKVTTQFGLPQKSDLSKAGAHLGTLSSSTSNQFSDVSGLGDILELIADIGSLFPDF